MKDEFEDIKENNKKKEKKREDEDDSEIKEIGELHLIIAELNLPIDKLYLLKNNLNNKFK